MELGCEVRELKVGSGGHHETPKGSINQEPRARTVRQRERGRGDEPGRGGGGEREGGRRRRQREGERRWELRHCKEKHLQKWDSQSLRQAQACRMQAIWPQGWQVRKGKTEEE